MANSLRAWMLVGALLGSGIASAQWTYDLTCTGNCAPGELGVSYTRGPFETEEVCEAARNADPDAQRWSSETGNLVSLGYCHGGSVSSGSSSSSSVSSGSHWTPGIGRFFAGGTPATLALQAPQPLATGLGFFGGFQMGRGAYDDASVYPLLEIFALLHKNKGDPTGNTTLGGAGLTGGIEWSPMAEESVAPILQLTGGLVWLQNDAGGNTALGVKGLVGIELGFDGSPGHDDSMRGYNHAFLVGIGGVYGYDLPALFMVSIGYAIR